MITLIEVVYLGLGIGANAAVSGGVSADHSDQLSGLLFSYYQMSSFILTDFPITNQILRLQITAPKYKHLLVPQGILTTLSMTNGRYRYDYATVPFLAEVFKVLFLLSALVFCRVKLKYFTQK